MEALTRSGEVKLGKFRPDVSRLGMPLGNSRSRRSMSQPSLALPKRAMSTNIYASKITAHRAITKMAILMVLGGQSRWIGQLCFAQQVCGEWLVNHDGACDILALWDLQLLDKISEMLHSNPGRLNEKQGRSGATLLHYAVLRNDIGLVRLLLSANPDLTITDDEAHSTPLGWAYYFQRHEISELLEKQTN